MGLPQNNGKKPISLSVGKANDIKRKKISGKIYVEVISLIGYFNFIRNNSLTPPKTKLEMDRVIGVLKKANEDPDSLPETPLAEETQP